MNERLIIQQMVELYSRCRSYEDQGQLDLITDPGTSTERRERIAFRTAFARPMFFRFEWKRFDQFTGKPDETESIWCDGRNAYARNRFEDGLQEFDSLDHAIANAINVNAHVISSLLMPTVLSFRFMRDGVLSSTADEMQLNEPCSHLIASTNEQRTDILVSKANFALRRIREDRILRGSNVNLPPLPANISPSEREEMIRVLSEATEDLHTISDGSYTHVAFDNAIPPSVFQVSQ